MQNNNIQKSIKSIIAALLMCAASAVTSSAVTPGGVSIMADVGAVRAITKSPISGDLYLGNQGRSQMINGGTPGNLSGIESAQGWYWPHMWGTQWTADFYLSKDGANMTTPTEVYWYPGETYKYLENGGSDSTYWTMLSGGYGFTTNPVFLGYCDRSAFPRSFTFWYPHEIGNWPQWWSGGCGSNWYCCNIAVNDNYTKRKNSGGGNPTGTWSDTPAHVTGEPNQIATSQSAPEYVYTLTNRGVLQSNNTVGATVSSTAVNNTNWKNGIAVKDAVYVSYSDTAKIYLAAYATSNLASLWTVPVTSYGGNSWVSLYTVGATNYLYVLTPQYLYLYTVTAGGNSKIDAVALPGGWTPIGVSSGASGIYVAFNNGHVCRYEHNQLAVKGVTNNYAVAAGNTYGTDIAIANHNTGFYVADVRTSGAVGYSTVTKYMTDGTQSWTSTNNGTALTLPAGAMSINMSPVSGVVAVGGYEGHYGYLATWTGELCNAPRYPAGWLTPGASTAGLSISAADLQAIRTDIGLMRTAAGEAACTYSRVPTAGNVVYAADINETRQCINTHYDYCSYPRPSTSVNTTESVGNLIKGTHWADMWSAVQNAP